MSHVPERRFHDTVAEFLRGKFPEAKVESEPRLSGSGRIPDFRVTTGDGDVYVVEVENDGDAAVGGLGQALVYSAHDPDYIPAVVVPDGHEENPEWDMVKRHAVGWTVAIDE